MEEALNNLSLFSSRPEAHPLVLRSFSWDDSACLCVSFSTQSWWSDVGEVTLVIRCAGVLECALRDKPGDSLSWVALKETSPLLEDYSTTASIFGNAPLPDPPRFFHEFHELVRKEMDGKRDPVAYLNWQGSFAAWRGIVLSRAYQLLSAPLQIAEAATILLDAQVADYVLLPDPPGDRAEVKTATQVFEFGSSWIVAEELVVEV